jgi:hypothetical protein
VGDDRIRLTESGQVILELRHRCRDGTTHLLFDPPERLERAATLTPRPRINLVLHSGVLAAHAAWRSRLAGTDQPRGDPAVRATPSTPGTDGTPTARDEAPRRHRSNLRWAQLMARCSRLRQGFSGPRRSASRAGGLDTTSSRVPGGLD